MEEKKITALEWLQEELEMINGKMALTLNGKLRAELHGCNEEKQIVTLRFPLQDWQINGLGTLHGGIISTMMDLTMSMAIYCFSRQSIPPTVTMTVNYLRPVPMDGGLLVQARVTSIGKRNATAYCEAVIPNSGKIACTAVGTYAVVVPRN